MREVSWFSLLNNIVKKKKKNPRESYVVDESKKGTVQVKTEKGPKDDHTHLS